MMILVSDIDGTILDRRTMSPRDALPGIALLKKRRIPLVLVSSKTLEEMEIIHGEFGLDAPFAFENGAGIAYPGDGDPGKGMWRIELAGPGVEALREAVPLIENAAGKSIILLEDMDIDDLMAWTGLSAEGARQAQKRRASMPFLIADRKPLPAEETARLNGVLRDLGYRVAWGGRFYHLLAGGAGKGDAVARLRSHYGELVKGSVTMIGIGDSENDFDLLEAVDIPYLVRSPGGGVDYGKVRFRVTRAFGPRGFTEAVLETWGD